MTKILNLFLFYLFSINVFAQPPSERILNRSFEQGDNQDAPPWILEGLNNERPLVVTDVMLAHTGKRFLSLGNKANVVEGASQIINIPATTKKAVKFSFWLAINTTEPKNNKQSQDLLAVTVNDMQGNMVELLEVYGDKDRKRFARYRQQEFNLSKFIGQTIEVKFMAANTGLFPTTFRLDDVSLASADFAISAEPNTITVAKNTQAPIFIEIERVANFSKEVTVIAPKNEELKPLNLSINTNKQVSKGSRVSFTLKIEPTAISGNYQLTFRAIDNKKRTRTTIITVIIL